MLRIKKNDTVLVLNGRDKGRQGTVIEICNRDNLVKIKGIAIVSRHSKPKKQGETPSIKKMEGFINLSNVMLISKDNKPCRTNFKIMEDGKKVRLCNRTKEIV